MKTATTFLNWLIRITGLFQLIVGVVFWVNQNDALIPFHILVGSVMVLSLWILSFLAFRSSVMWQLPTLAFILGLIVLALGLTQAQILSGSLHWLIQVLHLLLGLGAIGFGEMLSAGIKRIQQSQP